jgi:hypothetical protein
VPVAQEVDPQVIVTAPGRTIPSAPRAPEAGTVPKPAAGQTSAAPAGTEGPPRRHDCPWSGVGKYLRVPLSWLFLCPDPAFPFPPSKRRHGSAGLAPRKALKTVPASTASAAPCHAGRLAFTQDVPKRGAQAARVAMGRAPQADPSVEAAVVPGESAGAAVALSPPSGLPASAPASAEAVAVLPVEPPVTVDAEMAEAPLLEVGDRKPASLAEEVPDALTARGPDALEEGGAEPRPVLGSGDLIPTRRDPNERRGQALGSGPVAPQNPSSSLMMSGRSNLGMSSVSVPRQRWGRFGRPWRSFPGTFPGSST